MDIVKWLAIAGCAGFGWLVFGKENDPPEPETVKTVEKPTRDCTLSSSNPDVTVFVFRDPVKAKEFDDAIFARDAAAVNFTLLSEHREYKAHTKCTYVRTEGPLAQVYVGDFTGWVPWGLVKR
jgi:hypothetical protein